MRTRLFRLIAVVAVLAAVVVVGGAGPVNACSCAPITKTHEQRVADAEYAFNGVPTAVEDLNGKTYTFSVGQAFKGDMPNPVKISTPPDSAQCGTSFTIGTAYRVYAYKSGDHISTNLCSGNATVASMSEPDDNVAPPTTLKTTTTVQTMTTVEKPATTTSSTTTTSEPGEIALTQTDDGGGVNGALVAAIVVLGAGAIAGAIAVMRAMRRA